MKNFLAIFFTIIFFSSCGREQNNLSVSLIKEFEDTILLKGNKTPIYDQEVIPSITICDSLLLFHIFIQSHSPYLYRVYNLNTFTKVGDCLLNGRGPNEFNQYTAMLQSQPEMKENGNTKIWINNFPTKIVLLNLSSTIATGKTIIDKEYTFTREGKRNIFFESNATYTLDDGIFLMNKDINRSKNPDNVNPENIYIIYDYQNDKVLDTLKYQYNLIGWESIDKKRSKIVKTSYLEDLISIYDIANKQENVLFHTFKAPHELAQIGNFDIPRPDYIYQTCFIKQNLIFALYMKRKGGDSGEGTSRRYVHVFDLNGKPRYNLIIEEPIMTICLDERTSILYGIDDEGQLYSYDLKDFLQNK